MARKGERAFIVGQLPAPYDLTPVHAPEPICKNRLPRSFSDLIVNLLARRDIIHILILFQFTVMDEIQCRERAHAPIPPPFKK